MPLAARRMAGHSGRVLEIGNVMRKHLDQPVVDHVVVDKYEDAPEVRSIDALDVRGEFDLIVSVSTIEHIGLDESPREQRKASRAIHYLRSLLAKDGVLFATWPIGYNRSLDEALRVGELEVTTVGYLARETPWTNRWCEVDADDAHARLYGWPYPGGNAVAVCEWHTR